MRIPTALRNQARGFARGLSRLFAFGREANRKQLHSGQLRAQLAHSEEGSTLIELAMTVPVLMGLVTGLFAFGIAYSNQLTLTQAVGSAGQYLAQIRTTSTNPCADTFKALKNAAPNLVPANVIMTVTINGTTPVQIGESCAGSQTLLVQGTPVTVYATYPCTLNIYGVNLGHSCQLSAKVTEYEY